MCSVGNLVADIHKLGPIRFFYISSCGLYDPRAMGNISKVIRSHGLICVAICHSRKTKKFSNLWHKKYASRGYATRDPTDLVDASL